VVAAPGIRVEEIVAGLVLRRTRFRGARGAIVKALGVSPHFELRLDRLGARVWRLIDGKRTVGQILAQLRRDLPDEEELGPRLGQLIGRLAGHHFVALN